jgi:predicted signal transduction protein with EAL and GGDEF domain
MICKSRNWSLFFSIISAIAAIYCLMWIISASSLASEYCKGGFSLFADALRCRQVDFAVILAIIFFIFFLYFGWRLVRAGRGIKQD